LLIIFDLDDTLIDTSRGLTPQQLKKALHRMKDQGVYLGDFSKAENVLLRLNETASSAKHAILEFFEINQLDCKYFDMACKVVYDEISPDISIEPSDGALDVISVLFESHKLALVTVGVQHLQLMKLKKAGIHSHFFSKIVVTQERNKKLHYKAIIEELDFDPSDVLVCGDRIEVDLSPAKELGLKTVQMLSGRGLHCKGNKEDVDYRISHLSELIKILTQVSSITSTMGSSNHDI
jgi:putative hydrolase of the HAD superfamily